jgi:hypothetical protein
MDDAKRRGKLSFADSESTSHKMNMMTMSTSSNVAKSQNRHFSFIIFRSISNHQQPFTCK